VLLQTEITDIVHHYPRAWVNVDKLIDFPLSGVLFSVKPGIRGVPAFYFKGNK
jgi:hypothetical protein